MHNVNNMPIVLKAFICFILQSLFIISQTSKDVNPKFKIHISYAY
nr:MAG TPA: hypothetical protein [Caudoviricetes sp.]